MENIDYEKLEQAIQAKKEEQKTQEKQELSAELIKQAKELNIDVDKFVKKPEGIEENKKENNEKKMPENKLQENNISTEDIGKIIGKELAKAINSVKPKDVPEKEDVKIYL